MHVLIITQLFISKTLAFLIFSCVLGPYPPMPKFDLALLGKVDIPEENSSAGEEDEIEEQSQGYNASNPKKKKSDKPADEGTPEWEKVMVYDLWPDRVLASRVSFWHPGPQKIPIFLKISITSRYFKKFNS